MNSTISISTYYEYIQESFLALEYSLSLRNELEKEKEIDGADQRPILADMHARYSFILCANALEAAANALLLSIDTVNDNYKDLEKLPTMVKFTIFCNYQGESLPKGDARVQRINELIKCRNQFVHPKPKKTDYQVDGESIIFKVKKTSSREYPFYHTLINHQHALFAVEDTLGFLGWLCFDICKLEKQEGCLRLGIGSYGFTANIHGIAVEQHINLDLRTFNR